MPRVLEALHAACAAVPAGHEVGGRLLVRDRPDRGNVIAHFEEFENLADEPGIYLRAVFGDPPPGYRQLSVHSHPDGYAVLTDGDVEAVLTDEPDGAQEAVFAQATGRLRVWHVLPSRAQVLCNVEVERTRTSCYRSTRR